MSTILPPGEDYGPGRPRLSWIDTAKALGMVLVVLGHVLPTNADAASRTIVEGIFLFHMPLFFVLSGLLFTPGDSRTVFIKRVRSLLVPYVGYILLILLLDAVVSLAAGSPPSLPSARRVNNLILGGSFASGQFGVIWFLTCLFLVTIVFNEIATRMRDRPAAAYLAIGLALVVSAIAGWFPALPNPWGIFSVPAGLVAFFFGYKLRSADPRWRPVLLLVPVTLLAALAAYALFGADFHFDMKEHIFGPPVLGIALSLALSTAFIRGCRLLDERSPVPYLAKAGEYLLPILMLHQFVHLTLKDAGVQSVWAIAVLSFALPLAAGIAFDRWTWTRRIFLGRDERI